MGFFVVKCYREKGAEGVWLLGVCWDSGEQPGIRNKNGKREKKGGKRKRKIKEIRKKKGGKGKKNRKKGKKKGKKGKIKK